MPRKVAIVLFNLGGPDRQETVQPFLQYLFRDPAILRVPTPVRWGLARLISRLRAPSVKKNYALMNAPGGGSPLLPETEAQADALTRALAARDPDTVFQCFIAMRYWHPFTEEAAREVMEWAPDDVVLLPLYPQFSSTTTGSSLSAWNRAFNGEARTVCCYPFDERLIEAHAERIIEAWRSEGEPEGVRVLMSAHGLPESVVRDGDPYQWQVEQMAEKLKERLPADWETQVCYQSRVGPLKWIGPATEDEVTRAARDGRHVLIAPIAFVSEHIETLVELGIEYKELFEDHGGHGYTTVPALGTHPAFVDLLADLVQSARQGDRTLRSCAGGRLCPDGFTDCPFARETM